MIRRDSNQQDQAGNTLTTEYKQTSKRLSDVSQSRDNNFNLIRIVAALAVLVSHSFALATGKGEAQPFQDLLGMTIGTMAVDIFFVASGFLVTASLLGRRCIVEFLWARVLRIYPAYLVMLFLTVFVIGSTFTSLPTSVYLSSQGTYYYLAKCGSLLTDVVFDLPGVFNNNPYKNAVNGSLWSMPLEIRMYLILIVAWAAGNRFKRRNVSFEKVIIAFAVTSGIYHLCTQFGLAHKHQPFMKLFFMFFTGASFYIFKDRITLSRPIFYTFFGALLIALSVNKDVFLRTYPICIAYVLFYLAYMPSGFIRKYNKLGDYSYGIYIYAFPVQQSIAALVPGISSASMIFVSGSVTLFLSAISWHFLEKKALRLKGSWVERTRNILGFSSPVAE